MLFMGNGKCWFILPQCVNLRIGIVHYLVDEARNISRNLFFASPSQHVFVLFFVFCFVFCFVLFCFVFFFFRIEGIWRKVG